MIVDVKIKIYKWILLLHKSNSHKKIPIKAQCFGWVPEKLTFLKLLMKLSLISQHNWKMNQWSQLS
jgi:hypothetical protein